MVRQCPPAARGTGISGRAGWRCSPNDPDPSLSNVPGNGDDFADPIPKWTPTLVNHLDNRHVAKAKCADRQRTEARFAAVGQSQKKDVAGLDRRWLSRGPA